jgi:hypothetical protein
VRVTVAKYPTEAAYRAAIRTRITEPAERSGWPPEQITKRFVARQLAISMETYRERNKACGIAHEDIQYLRIR